MPTPPVSAVLRAYADLCPAPNESSSLVVAGRGDLAVLGPGPMGHEDLGLASPGAGTGRVGNTVLSALDSAPTHYPVRPSSVVERLSRLDALHADEQLLRHGWVLIAGTVLVDGERRPVLQPLLSQPVQLRQRSAAGRALRALSQTDTSSEFTMRPLGEAEISPGIVDPARRAELTDGAQFGGGALQLNDPTDALIRRLPHLTAWIRDAAAAAGLPVQRVVASASDPHALLESKELVAIVTHCLYVVRQVNPMSMRTTLQTWATRPGIDRTALATVLRTSTGPAPLRTDAVESPMLLSPSQREVVVRARTEPVTVVSGAPGSGKTHTVCAVALDAVARGDSVLIATQSRHAADVVTELLQRTPGPEPVRFGDGAGMRGLIDELSDRQSHPLGAEDVRRLDEDLALARTEVAGLRSSIAADLQLEADAADAVRWQDALPALLACAPSAFDVDSDLARIESRLAEVRADRDAAASGDAGGPIRRWRSRRRRRALDRLTGASAGTELTQLSLAVDAARSGRAAATLAARGGIRIGERWDRLEAAEQRHRDAVGHRLHARPFEPSRLNGEARIALGQLITALRAGRGRRRELLGELDPGQLTSAAPLWIGTLSEIEDVLPATAALFDVVVLDEASQIEQPRAAPALLRAERAVVVGDPHQLRHVSFRSDADIDSALTSAGLVEWRGLLDTRRVSSFDLAAATNPVDHLRDHFRSVPHLIEFSVRHFYRDRVEVMTRHPRNESFDAIDTVDPATGPAAAPGSDEDPGATTAGNAVYQDEIDAALVVLRALQVEGTTSVGVISPFRDQADALEEALVTEFDADEIDRMSLRVGTVHAFQGGERDVVVASLALRPGDSAGRRRFLENPNLFNVMVTRARRRMIVVTSLPRDVGGLTGEYLRYGEQGLEPVRDGEERPGWPSALATELRRNGTAVRTAYPVGPWRLELCIGDGESCRYLESTVDRAGTEAHIDRHLTLMRLGWTIVDAWPSLWDGDAVRAALDLRETS